MKIITFIFILMISVSAFADVTITEESSGSTLKTYFAKNIMAHYIDDQLTNITDVGSEKVYVLNPMAKTYFEATFSQLKSFADKMKSMVDSDQMKQYIGKTPKVGVKTAKKASKKIAGYSCDEYSLTIETLFTEANVCFSNEVYKLVEKELDVSKAEKLLNEMDMDESSNPIGSKISEMERKLGYVLEQSTSGGVPGFDTLVTEISKEKIKKSVFKVPANYKKIPMSKALGTY